jgi:hypothetical protein
MDSDSDEFRHADNHEIPQENRTPSMAFGYSGKFGGSASKGVLPIPVLRVEQADVDDEPQTTSLSETTKGIASLDPKISKVHS